MDDQTGHLDIGPDGLPTDPEDPWRKCYDGKGGDFDFEADRRAFVDQLLQKCERAFREGSLPALADAIDLCREHGRPLPAWATEGALACVAFTFRRARRPDRLTGRNATLGAQHQQNMNHLTRWDAVKELRERQPELADIAETWIETFDEVAEMLAGTDAEGCPDTVRHSYRVVERARRGDNFTGRFYLPRTLGRPKVG